MCIFRISPSVRRHSSASSTTCSSSKSKMRYSSAAAAASSISRFSCRRFSTGLPLIYEMNSDLSVASSRYLADEEAVKAAAEAVANQARS